MKRKNLVILTICLSILFSFAPASAVYAMEPISITEPDTVSPCAHYTEWRYKVVNGMLYRRLYDCTDQCWIGDWEAC